MIDDPEKTALFISRLKELLPIDAGIAKDLQRSLAAKSPEIAIPARLAATGYRKFEVDADAVPKLLSGVNPFSELSKSE